MSGDSGGEGRRAYGAARVEARMVEERRRCSEELEEKILCFRVG